MIKFHCKHCSGKVGVKDAYAGRRVRCPKCKEPVRVPKPKVEDDFELEMVAAGGAGGADDFDLEMVSERDAGGGSSDLNALAAMEAGADAQVQAAGATCPSCGSLAKPGAALCVACGYNFKSGRKLNTAVTAAPFAGKGKPKKDKQVEDPASGKDIWWGIAALIAAVGIFWYLWDFEQSNDQTREIYFIVAWLYNIGGPTFGKWLASVPFALGGIYMLYSGAKAMRYD